MQIDLFLGVLSFTGVVLLLVAIIIAARSQLVSSGDVTIEINGDSSNPIVVPSGNKLLQTLAENKIFLSSACGGGGTCSQCKCQISEGGGSILPTEESHFNSKEKKDGWRLSCQVAVKQDMKIQVPEEVFGDLYFELHEEKQEVYVVTHVDEQAWPAGVGGIRFGFDEAVRQNYTSDFEFKKAFADAVSAYEQVRHEIDRQMDVMRVEEGVAINDAVMAKQTKAWLKRIPTSLLDKETHFAGLHDSEALVRIGPINSHS